MGVGSFLVLWFFGSCLLAGPIGAWMERNK